MFNQLFQPIQIRDMQMKNRVVLPAMGTRMATEQSEITQRLVDYHVARVEGGCGLNIVEVASIHTPSAPAYFVSISEDAYIPGHKMLTKAVHKAGGRVGIQLWQGSIAVGMDPTAKVFVVNDTPFGEYTLPAITREEMDEIINAYGEATRRSVEAGYDCIEFHCAHNYLPHSFLSGGLNHRQDEFGGSFENRVKFPLACIRAIRKNMPEGMPLFMRIGAHDDCLPGGMTIEETIEFCKLAKVEGVDVLDVSRGNIITEATVYEVPPIDIPQGFNVDNAGIIRQATGMLTIAVGRINTAQLAEEVLEQEKADMVVMGRAQLADPEFCNKAKAGKVDEIIHCCACNQGCFDGFCDVEGRPFITCLRNPAVGHEVEYRLKQAKQKKTVWIAGAGIAGLEAARVLRRQGHDVVIFEAGKTYGGQFVTAGKAPGKAEMEQAAKSLGELVLKLGAEIRLETPLTPEAIQEGQPDEVILAIGASPMRLALEGSDHKPMFTANNVLNGEEQISGDTLVIGGGLVGLEVADYVASQGHKVTVVEMQDKAGKDLGAFREITVMKKMQELGVTLHTDTKCIGVNTEGVVASSGGQEFVIPCQNIVVAIGSQSNVSQELQEACEQNNVACYVVGDAKTARRAINAVEEAFLVARSI